MGAAGDREFAYVLYGSVQAPREIEGFQQGRTQRVAFLGGNDTLRVVTYRRP